MEFYEIAVAAAIAAIAGVSTLLGHGIAHRDRPKAKPAPPSIELTPALLQDMGIDEANHAALVDALNDTEVRTENRPDKKVRVRAAYAAGVGPDFELAELGGEKPKSFDARFAVHTEVARWTHRTLSEPVQNGLLALPSLELQSRGRLVSLTVDARSGAETLQLARAIIALIAQVDAEVLAPFATREQTRTLDASGPWYARKPAQLEVRRFGATARVEPTTLDGDLGLHISAECEDQTPRFSSSIRPDEEPKEALLRAVGSSREPLLRTLRRAELRRRRSRIELVVPANIEPRLYETGIEFVLSFAKQNVNYGAYR
ncbi:MAG: hypothetical protein AAGF12_00750 [Myxococcota bacterium]